MKLSPVEVPFRPEWFRATAFAARDPEFKIDAASGTIEVFDGIGGDGVTPAKISAALRSISGPVTVKINSPGGSFFDGLAVYNILVQHPRPVTGEIIGIAASAASIVAMGCSPLRMARHSRLMIHQACGVVSGNADAMAEIVQTLRQIDTTMAEIYRARSGQTIDTILGWMSDETFFTADAAVHVGLADSLLDMDAIAAMQKMPSRQKLEFEHRNLGFSRRQSSKMAAAAFAALGREIATEPTPVPEPAPEPIDFDAIARAIADASKAAVPPRRNY